MPASSISLDSLSSPSPSPSPPPPRQKGSAAHKAQVAYTNKQAVPPHGLGSDSELSELTEEEQDTTDKRENAPRAPDGDSTVAGDDESAGGTSVGGDVSTSTSTNPSRRARQKASLAGAKKGAGRKKRSSLVPAPMWGWAETKSNVHEEEEEEEMSGPPKAMEEEEDEEEGEEDRGTSSGHPASVWVVRKAKGKRVVSRDEDDDGGDAMEIDQPSKPGKTNGVSGSPKNKADSGAEDGEEEEAGSEEGESEDDKNVRIRRPKKLRSVSRTDSKDQTESEGDEESDKEKQKPILSLRRPVPPPPRRRGPFGRLPRTARKWMLPREGYDWKKPIVREAPIAETSSPKDKDNGTEDEESEDDEDEKDEGDGDVLDPDAEDADLPELVSTVDDFGPTVVGGGSARVAGSPSKPPSSRALDPPGPLVEVIAAAAAASSIMAGSEVVDPPSPGTSVTSRSVSPERIASTVITGSIKKTVASAGGDEDGDNTPTPTQPEKKEKPPKHVPSSLDIGTDEPEVEDNRDNEISADVDVDEPENDQEQEVENDNEVDAEVEEPSPEDDLEVELESDLQPAHRAEALDVLAAIELKFALLRERVYVEKMEGLAWEEKLVNEGSHPELIHIQKELLKRRDKRLELATRKREYELKNVAKKRRINEDSTWSWWKLARDELQTDMIAEASRKRRKLERERRATERPQGVRRLPMPPSEVPPAPSLRRIIKSFPFVEKHKTQSFRSTPKQGVYPELAGLSTQEINADLEVFLSNRRGYDFRSSSVIGFPAQIAPPLGFGGYDAYTDHMGNPIAPPGRIPPQHVPSFHQVPTPQGYAYPSSGTGRLLPPLHGHGHPGPHGGPPGSAMYPVDEAMGVVPSAAPHHYYGPQVNGGYPPESAPAPGVMVTAPPGHHGKRSPSPIGSGLNGKQPHGGWIGPGIAPGVVPVSTGYLGPGQGRSKGEWASGDERRGNYPMGTDDEERERERMVTMMKGRDQFERERREIMDRDRDRERERDRREGDRETMSADVDRERERHMHMISQHRQVPPPPLHQHVHGIPPTQHHHIVGGHHHPRAPHHHHVVHHHHNQPSIPIGSNAAPPLPGSAMHSPRAPREYADLRPGSGHGQYPTEVINVALNAKHGPQAPPRDEYSGREQGEYRDNRERLRPSRRSSPAPGPSSQLQGGPGPVVNSLPQSSTESDRLIPTPFVMASTQAMQATSVNGSSSPRVGPGYDAHVRSPGHRFSGTGRSAPTTGPPTPSTGPPPLPSGMSKESLTMSPARRPPPPQSPVPLNERERDRDRDRERFGVNGPAPSDMRGPPVSGPGVSSPNLQRPRSPGPPGPVKYGPPPPPPPSSGSGPERERTPAMRPTSAGATSPLIGYKMRPISPPVGSKSLGGLQPLVSPMMGLAGPGRAATPIGIERRSAPLMSPARSANGNPGGDEDDRERKERAGAAEEAKMMTGPGVPPSPAPATPSAGTMSPPVTLPPPSKMSVPQMIDGR